MVCKSHNETSLTLPTAAASSLKRISFKLVSVLQNKCCFRGISTSPYNLSSGVNTVFLSLGSRNCQFGRSIWWIHIRFSADIHKPSRLMVMILALSICPAWTLSSSPASAERGCKIREALTQLLCLLLAVLVQACVSWPIREDFVFRRGGP